MPDFLSIRPEVADALAERRAVVAFESTLIAHGLPHPHNLETARAAEATARAGGAVPATIAVLDGRIRVGLDDSDLERLATGAGIGKLSRRDLAVVLARGGDGATTVAATMACAHLVGIGVFATGGIGGVHRGAIGGIEASLDISADLDELARTPVAVVAAGAKSILDLPRTLEYLETRGVPVLGYRTDRFPAFYVADSGLPVPHRLDSPALIARTIRIQAQFGAGGILIANPIPAAASLDPAVIESAITEAIAEAERAGVRGPALTPYLLRSLDRQTGGLALAANLALILNNATLGAEIAVALAALTNNSALPRRHPVVRLGR